MAQEQIAVKRRQVGETEIEYKSIGRQELKSYKQQGWVENRETLPAPEMPDLEVLELLAKDAAEELARVEVQAKKMVGKAQADESNARLAVINAKNAIAREEEFLAESKLRTERQGAIHKASTKLKEVFPKPIPARVLIGMGYSEEGQAAIRETFVNESHTIGKDSTGDWLIVDNKIQWLAEKGKREAEEAKKKEDAIRARMEAK